MDVNIVPAEERPSPPRARLKVSRFTMTAVTASFVLISYAWSLDTGLFLDDHAHLAHLRDWGWSFQEAVNSSRLGIVGEVVDIWGRNDSGLKFFRPIAFWIMKLEYTLVKWNPVGMHGFCLGWHFLNCMLVGALAMRCLGDRLWATVAAVLMAIHPNHMGTVFWIACQTELLTTAFLLMAVLAYANYSGWAEPFFFHHKRPQAPRRFAVLWGLLAILLYALALGCRENSLLFPLVCVAGDFLLKPRGARRIQWVPPAMVAVLVVYFIVRSQMLGGFVLPGRPYIIPPTDPTFIPYVFQKFGYYMMGLFGFFPVVPLAGQTFFAQSVAAFYTGVAGTGLTLFIIWSVYKFRIALLWPLVWICILIAPVMPVFASSHHLYLPCLGMALLATAGLAALGGLWRESDSPLPKAQLVLCVLLLAAHAAALTTVTLLFGYTYRSGTAVEDMVVDDILRRGKPLKDGDHLFFINMPLLAYYAVPAIENQTGVRHLHGHALSFCPWILRMESPSELEVLDRHRLRIRSPENARYFEGQSGQMLLEAMGLSKMPAPGETVRADNVNMTVTTKESDAKGIRAIEFQFDQPLDSPNYHFYFGSPQFMAYPMQFPRSMTENVTGTQPGL